MKKAVVLFLCAILLAVCCVPVGAHSGNTDVNGGHYDHSTGDYHYHHGYSAHDHKDGKCPYAHVKTILSIICLIIFLFPFFLFWIFFISLFFKKDSHTNNSDSASHKNISENISDIEPKQSPTVNHTIPWDVDTDGKIIFSSPDTNSDEESPIEKLHDKEPNNDNTYIAVAICLVFIAVLVWIWVFDLLS